MPFDKVGRAPLSRRAARRSGRLGASDTAQTHNPHEPHGRCTGPHDRHRDARRSRVGPASRASCGPPEPSSWFLWTLDVSALRTSSRNDLADGGGSWLRESRARGDLDSGASEAPCRSARPQTPPSWSRCTGRSTGRALTLRRVRQADVLFGIALALLSSRTSFSSSLIRCASSVVVPGRVPWSIWAFLTQVRRASGWTPSSRRSCGSRPWPAPGQPAPPTPVLVARSRSSSGYLVCPNDSDPYLASLPPSNPGRFKSQD